MATAEEALKRIGELYAIEEAIRGLPATERLRARQSQSKPLLASLHEWLTEKSVMLSKKSRLGVAFAYVLNQWDALCYYWDDGLAEADNNAAERALRAVRLGKRTTSSSAVTTVASVEHCSMVLSGHAGSMASIRRLSFAIS